MDYARLIDPITDWFSANRVMLPWREKKGAYPVWISEIMLQQTRIEAVIPYYNRFMKELPDVAALASCPEERLLKLWEGLGYYSRARNLKKAAEIICNEMGGVFPEEAEALCRLPGIGAYTAGAIASIAFGKPSPAADGNVLRVLARVAGDESDIALPQTRRRAGEILGAVYPVGEKAALFTEGIMELGERICLPNGAPLCEKCPLRAFCIAFAENKTLSLPVKGRKAARRIEKKTVLLLESGGEYALRRREKKGLLAGLWEWINLPEWREPDEIRTFLEEKGLEILRIDAIGKARHIFTHLEWEMCGYKVSCRGKCGDWEWHRPEEIRRDYALPTAFRAYTDQI